MRKRRKTRASLRSVTSYFTRLGQEAKTFLRSIPPHLLITWLGVLVWKPIRHIRSWPVRLGSHIRRRPLKRQFVRWYRDAVLPDLVDLEIFVNIDIDKSNPSHQLCVLDEHQKQTDQTREIASSLDANAAKPVDYSVPIQLCRERIDKLELKMNEHTSKLSSIESRFKRLELSP